MSAAAEDPTNLAALARRLTEPADATVGAHHDPLPLGQDRQALAWALKDLGYAAWHDEPPRVPRVAAVLGALAAHVPAGHAALRAEVRGLACWIDGIAALVRGQLAEGVTGFDAAAAALSEAGNPDAAAQTQVPKVMALSLLGRRTEAAACAESALQVLRALGNWPVAARVGLNLGNLQLLRAAYAQAVPHFREAAVLFARQGDRRHSVLADIGLAEALAALGDLDEAQRIVARARMRTDHPGLGLQQALVEESAALLALVRGRYPEALAGLEAARRRYEGLGVPQYLAIGEKQLADAYLELRLLPEARSLLDASVAQFAALAMPDEQAGALAQRGRAEAMLGQRAAADASFAQAAALFEQLGQGTGAASVALARAELAMATSADAALAWAEQAAAGYATAGQADGQARAAVIRGQALLALGRADASAAVFDAALSRARELGLTQIQVRCLSGLGLAALAQGRQPAALQALDAAIELAEDQHRALPGDEIRHAFLTDHLRPYHERLKLALAEGDATQVLWQLERLRARSLDESPAEAMAAAPDAQNPDAQNPDAEHERALRERLNWLYRRVQRLQDEARTAEAEQAELRRLEHALLEAARRRRLAALAPGASAGAAPPGLWPGLDLPALQASMQAGDTMVVYGVVEDELLACVLSVDQLRLHRHLASWAQVRQAVQAVRFQLEALRHGSALLQRHLNTLLKRLGLRLAQAHALVWAPLAPSLAGAQRVLLVPHADLGALPFAALAPAGGPPLSDLHALALAPSARAAGRSLRAPARALQRALALGESSRLPQAAAEARAVAACYPAGRVLEGVSASPDALRAGLPGADVLHLACHAQFRSDNPRFSALHLHGGALTAHEAEHLPLAARDGSGPLVVLSACETALAEAGPLDEMVGLVRAFLRAGASRVLASLWPVDDLVTARFMADLHPALAAGLPPAEALREAQRRLRQSHPHPFFWAPFTLFGGW